MTALHRRRRAGFSLVELLVVIAMLAVLAALGAGAYFRVRGSAQVKATEETVSKLETSLHAIWRAELDSARDSYKGKTTGYATQVDLVKALAGDEDRALSLWTYFWMKNAFPQSFDDGLCPNLSQRNGTTPFTTPDTRKGAWVWNPSVTTTPAVLIIPQSKIYSLFPNTAPTTAQLSAEQSAFYLYRTLTQKSARGQTFNEEATGSFAIQVTSSGITERVFSDSFGNPLAFARFGATPEMMLSPFVKPGLASSDPLDPLGKLGATAANWPNKTHAQASLGIAFGTVGTTAPPANWMPCIVARATKPDWTGFPIGSGILQLPNDPDGMIYGYKLRRQGARGDQ